MGKFLNIGSLERQKGRLKNAIIHHYRTYKCSPSEYERDKSLNLADSYAHELALLTGFYDIKNDPL